MKWNRIEMEWNRIEYLPPLFLPYKEGSNEVTLVIAIIMWPITNNDPITAQKCKGKARVTSDYSGCVSYFISLSQTQEVRNSQRTSQVLLFC